MLLACQHVHDLAPNMGLWWYFFAEIFDHFRTFFIFIFHAQSLLLLVPLTIRLRQTPLVLAVIACMLNALFKVCANRWEQALCSPRLTAFAARRSRTRA